MSGRAVPIEEVPDEVFSQKMLGVGISVIPDKNEVCAPFDAEVVQVFETKHSYTLRAEDGLEALIHIGINTVELVGEGFESYVKEKQKLRMGEPLAFVNLELLKEKGYSEHTPIIFVNGDTFRFDFKYGKVVSGKTLIASYSS
jgi:glucose-specific phosphotransferase system IIA component